MKKLIAILLLASTSVFAAPVKSTLQIVCDDTKSIFEHFVEGEYQEVPFWAGFEDSNKTSFVLLTNKETGTWTMIQYNAKRGCVIAVGDKWKPAAAESLKPNKLKDAI
jgi:hypothetical protein